MAKLGAVLGPWPGTFWLDVKAHELVVHEGRDGIAAEVRVPVSAETMAELLEGLLVEPMAPVPVELSEAPRPALVAVETIEPRRQGSRVARAERRAARPETVVCRIARCGQVIEVQARGPVPRLCARCRYGRSVAPGAMSKVAEIEQARRGA